MITVPAPAKLNLTLEVLGKRSDGFHEIRSVVQTINLRDTLHFQLSQNIELRCDEPDWVAERSLVSKVINLLQETTGYSTGAIVEINKSIPMVSGLGGDSSDAAATLWGLNKLWGLDLSPARLQELAWQLGSDVAFFLYGGTALLEGRGEIVTPLAPLPHRWAVLVVPPAPRLPGKTARLYAALKVSHHTGGQITDRFVQELRAGSEPPSSLLFNTFENVAFAPNSEIGVYRKHVIKVGAASVHLAGSGPTLFTLMEDKSYAEELYTRLQQQKLESYLAETLTAVDLSGMSGL